MALRLQPFIVESYRTGRLVWDRQSTRIAADLPGSKPNLRGDQRTKQKIGRNGRQTGTNVEFDNTTGGRSGGERTTSNGSTTSGKWRYHSPTWSRCHLQSSEPSAEYYWWSQVSWATNELFCFWQLLILWPVRLRHISLQLERSTFDNTAVANYVQKFKTNTYVSGSRLNLKINVWAS